MRLEGLLDKKEMGRLESLSEWEPILSGHSATGIYGYIWKTDPSFELFLEFMAHGVKITFVTPSCVTNETIPRSRDEIEKRIQWCSNYIVSHIIHHS